MMKRLVLSAALLLVLPFAAPAAQSVASVEASASSLSPLASRAIDLGVAPDAFPVQVVVGLALRDAAGLDAFLRQASDPASPLFQQWLTLDEINARYGPTPAQEARVVDWLTGSGFRVQTTPDRLLVVAQGSNAAAQKAFGVPIHLVTLDGMPRFAVLAEPRFPADVASFTTGVTGLDDLARMQPRANVGGSCCSFSPNDLKTLYANTAGYDGTGQTIALAGAYAWLDSDVTTFNTQWSLAALPTGSGQVCTGATGSGCVFNSAQSLEVSLDVEYAHGTAPGAVIKNYMSSSTLLTDFQVMYNRIVVDNPGHTVSSSWGSCESGTSVAFQQTADNIIAAGAAEGQSWFIASGDSGSHGCGDATVTVDVPANSPHAMGVGGTHATCSSGMTSGTPACGGYSSESAWSGSGGGRSATFSKPSWQTGCSVPADGARDVPDVALESDTGPGNYVRHNGGWYVVGGTSDAAPQWGGYFAELNQKKGGSGLGLPGPRLYALCGTSSYHDVTTGSNGFSAGTGYDLATGLGSVNVANLLAAY